MLQNLIYLHSQVHEVVFLHIHIIVLEEQLLTPQNAYTVTLLSISKLSP